MGDLTKEVRLGRGQVLPVLWSQLPDRGSFNGSCKRDGRLHYLDPGEMEEPSVPRVCKDSQAGLILGREVGMGALSWAESGSVHRHESVKQY